ncbi:hypothetical protein FQA39_LY08541 [Lamprigera yunnana]|nr:hypothetical protein FQA39_LY08541 [Lamprigera yunnana]
MQHPGRSTINSIGQITPSQGCEVLGDNQYFVTEYEEFVQWFFEDFASPQALSDRREMIRSRLRKENAAALSVPQEETQTATSASTHAKLKCEVEPEPSQRETKVTQLNAYTTAASEVTIDKLDATAENDNYNASVDKTQKEELEQSTAAVEEEDGIPEGKVGEREKQVLPTAQCDLRPMKSDPRQRGGAHTNGGLAESTNQATYRDGKGHGGTPATTLGAARGARHAEDGIVRKRVRPTSDGNSTSRDYKNTVKVSDNGCSSVSTLKRARHQLKRCKLLGRWECYRVTCDGVGGSSPTEVCGVLAYKYGQNRK